jgi:hypothetical protein
MGGETKIIELRDDATCMIVIVWLVRSHNDQEAWALRHIGFGKPDGGSFGTHMFYEGHPYMMAYDVENRRCDYDMCRLFGGSERYSNAMEWVREHFDELEGGEVVDVRFINGETNSPCKSDRWWMA